MNQFKHLRNLVLTLTVVLISMLTGISQTLPKNMVYSNTEHMLKTGNQVFSNFYDDTKLESIYIYFDQSDYWQMLHDATQTNDYISAKLYYKGETLENIGVQFKGQTSYSKIIDEDKLSFAISLDEYIDGQDIEGYNTLNLNNAYEDASFMLEVFYLNLNRRNIPAAQGNFVKLYINNEYWGIYDNIQQLNKDFTKEWFMTNNGSLWRADVDTGTTLKEGGPGGGGGGPGGGGQWGDGTAALNYHDDDTTTYQQYYTLKSSDQENPWDLLVKVTDILNNTSDENLFDSIDKYMNIDRTLWFLAHETIFSDDDSYVYKGKMDYYLYYEPETGQMVPLEFDGNSVMKAMNQNWDIFKNEENENYPLMNKLFSIPQLRQRYLAHVRTIINELMDESFTDSILDSYYDLIKESVYADTKKLESNIDFETSFQSIKDFISNRKSFIMSNAEVNVSSPVISSVTFKAYADDYSTPNANETVDVYVNVDESSSIGYVYLYYGTGYVGGFTKVSMSLNSENEYTAEIPGFEAGDYVRFYIEAVASDAAKTASYSPEGATHDVYFYRVNVAEVETSDLVINEILASNSTIAADEYDEYDDYIELYNNSDSPISLFGYYLTDDASDLTKWGFPDVTMEANSYLIIWADGDETQGDLHANFKLSASGEEVLLVNSDLNIADQLFYTNQTSDISYGRYPNGIGNFQLLLPTYNQENDNSSLVSVKPEAEIANSFKVYPNPAIDILNIEFSNTDLYGNIDIYEVTGKKIKSIDINSTKMQIDISQIDSGIYILKTNKNETELIHKL